MLGLSGLEDDLVDQLIDWLSPEFLMCLVLTLYAMGVAQAPISTKSREQPERVSLTGYCFWVTPGNLERPSDGERR